MPEPRNEHDAPKKRREANPAVVTWLLGRAKERDRREAESHQVNPSAGPSIKYSWEEMCMKWVNSLRQLNIRQRIVLWIGGVALLAGLLYPQFQTNYYAWVNGDNAWVLFYKTNRRMFVADGAFSGMPDEMKRRGILNCPELPRTFDRDEWAAVYVDKRDSIRIGSFLVQALAVSAVTLGLVWALKRDS
jgi:hypothetical protein